VLARSYSDHMSGKRLDRPGLQQALHDARAGGDELLLVCKVDRLARSTGGLARVLEEAIVAAVLAALDDGSSFQEAARRGQQAWHARHPGRQAELAGVRAAQASGSISTS
jgi:Resolvase, N terminal domain